jgi:glutaredoxin-like protein NrdH
MKVVVWSTPSCVQCTQTKKQFEKNGVIFEEMNLLDHPEKLDEFKAKGLLQAPIVEAGNAIWSGFRLDKIKSVVHKLFGESVGK